MVFEIQTYMKGREQCRLGVPTFGRVSPMHTTGLGRPGPSVARPHAEKHPTLTTKGPNIWGTVRVDVTPLGGQPSPIHGSTFWDAGLGKGGSSCSLNSLNWKSSWAFQWEAKSLNHLQRCLRPWETQIFLDTPHRKVHSPLWPARVPTKWLITAFTKPESVWMEGQNDRHFWTKQSGDLKFWKPQIYERTDSHFGCVVNPCKNPWFFTSVHITLFSEGLSPIGILLEYLEHSGILCGIGPIWNCVGSVLELPWNCLELPGTGLELGLATGVPLPALFGWNWLGTVPSYLNGWNWMELG